MKKNGQIAAGGGAAGIPVVSYRPSPGRPPGLEILDLPGLTARAVERGIPVTEPARPAFHLIVAMHGGQLECSVDFTSYTLGAGDWLWVWPGQVLQLADGPGDGDATVLVFPTGFPSTAAYAFVRDGEHLPNRRITPGPARQAALLRLLDALVEEHDDLSGLPLEAYVETLADLLSVILIRLVHLGDPRRHARSGGNAPFHLFCQAVEEGFGRTHRVEDYAAQLGYSSRTLTRATQAALGCGAKRYVDDRVLLEAKRLLIHSSLPPAAISNRIGFAYPTVFSAFFRQHTGMTPTEFRALAKG
ncbi:AraC family transcriptional regulator [Streptomyces sp. NBC_00234]|uniref:helix-turn-helix transcriptional regulator n=1 Tax=Streptomyces sp. NBC_00234 TaxID=2903638 RepID=UPI002E2902D2|nr:AraC family transcriptional regulator [Streptomyces sp. NBC_00234]